MKSYLLLALFPAIFFTNAPLHAQDNTAVFSTSDPAPAIKSSDGRFQFNIRGRIMADWSSGSDNDIVNNFSGTKLRAARLGIGGQATENINFRFDAVFGQDEVNVKDAYIQFRKI